MKILILILLGIFLLSVNSFSQNGPFCTLNGLSNTLEGDLNGKGFYFENNHMTAIIIPELKPGLGYSFSAGYIFNINSILLSGEMGQNESWHDASWEGDNYKTHYYATHFGITLYYKLSKIFKPYFGYKLINYSYISIDNGGFWIPDKTLISSAMYKGLGKSFELGLSCSFNNNISFCSGLTYSFLNYNSISNFNHIGILSSPVEMKGLSVNIGIIYKA